MTKLRTAAALLALAAPATAVAAYGPDIAPRAPAAAAAVRSGPAADNPRYAMSIGKPVELTVGEAQSLRALVPGVDPATIPPAKVGRLRAILYSRGNDAEKRSRIESLLN